MDMLLTVALVLLALSILVEKFMFSNRWMRSYLSILADIQQKTSEERRELLDRIQTGSAERTASLRPPFVPEKPAPEKVNLGDGVEVELE